MAFDAQENNHAKGDIKIFLNKKENKAFKITYFKIGFDLLYKAVALEC